MTKNGLKGLVTGIILAGTVGCDNQEMFKGNFRGYDVMVVKNSKNVQVLIAEGGSYPYTHFLIGDDFERDGIFDEIRLDGVYIDNWKELNPETFNDHPLSKYANTDSLKAAYDYVITQNKKKGK